MLITQTMIRPREATLAITYRCNARCVMCNIWQCESGDELPPKEYGKLPTTLRTLNITGGEPFLRKDFVEIVEALHGVAPKCRVVISTNGFLTDKILGAVSETIRFHDKLGLGISIDGIGEMHDNIRGTKGAFEKAIETVKGLKRLGLTDLRLGMTIMDQNSHQVLDVYHLAESLGIEFTTTVAHNSSIYFRKNDNKPMVTENLSRDIRTLEREHLRSFAAKNWFRAYHLEGVINSDIRSKGRRKCAAGRDFFFMDPSGCVYPCIVLDEPMGNIRDFSSFDDLFNGPKASEIRAKVAKCAKDCWMVCNIRTLFASHPGAPVMWVLRNKPKAHLSRRS